MRNLFTVFRVTLVRNRRDIGNVLGMTLIFPILLILILGTGLGAMFGVSSLEAVQVAYCNEDAGFLGSEVDEFLAREEVVEFLAVQKVGTLAQGQELLAAGEVDAFILVPADYSAKFQAGEQVEITLMGVPKKEFSLNLVKTVLEGFIAGGNATMAMTALGNPAPQYYPAMEAIADHPLPAAKVVPSALGYYSVTMLAMITMYASMWGAFAMGASYFSPLGQRVKASPLKAREFFIGTTLGNVATFFISSLVVISFTHYVYGVDWGNNLPLILLIALLNILVAIGLGSAATMIARDANKATVFLHLLVVAASVLGGSYYKISLPVSLSWVQYLSPNFLVQTAYFNTIYDGPAGQTAVVMGIMAGIVLICFAASMLAERRQGA